ncbi:protein kinase family protein [Frankia torreyi]|uniref:non-specific serine/threonine protein kinase n=2 Tax=Frankia TaxID=1854 RepID=A0A0D8BJ12_9ACTN|nr:protein kinase [Frankia torreyi]KJE24136.1 protein kinase family protein [Frankia torreyi]
MLTPLLEDDPRQIGPYRLQNRIGAGGMGTVYLGFTPEQHPVAVKVAAEELAEDAEFRSRFEREVHAALRVRGNAVAAVLDADTDAPAPWMVTEYVEGISLAEAVRARGRLENHLVRGLAVGLADALVAIHAAGVVHRDLKPSNILLAWDGPKVIDFGVAHISDSSTLTRTGHVIGTLAWMSPEQMRGDASDSSADIFAWASCVTYAATGRHPFHAETPDKLALRVQRDTPDLDALPAYLLTSVAGALSKIPRQRPTASALLASLVGREVQGVTEADAVAGDFLERTWTGTARAASEGLTVLPVGEWTGGDRERAADGPEGDGRSDPAVSGDGRPSTAGGWSPAVQGPPPASGPWPVGPPPPASAFRPAVSPPPTIPPPPPLPASRLTPLPPSPLPPSSSAPSSSAPSSSVPSSSVPSTPSPPAGRVPPGPSTPAGSQPVVSPWTYDIDEPDSRAPVRPRREPRPDPRAAGAGRPGELPARPAPQEIRPAPPEIRPGSRPDGPGPGESRAPDRGAWPASRETRPRPRADQAEDTIRPPDPTPPARPPDPSEFQVWIRPASSAPSSTPAPSTPASSSRASSARPAYAPLPAPPLPALPPRRAAAAAPGGTVAAPGGRGRRLPVTVGGGGDGEGSDARRFPPTTPVEHGLNGRALLSVVLALGWLFGLGSVAAIVVGSVAQAQIRRHNQRGRRLAALGIALGWTGIGLTVVSLLIVLAVR